MLIYLLMGILFMIMIISRPGYMRGFKDGFDEGYYGNEKVKEYFENNETLYKICLFTGILGHILTGVLLWPYEILSRLLR